MDSYAKLKVEKDRILAREKEEVARAERERIANYFAGTGTWNSDMIALAIREQWWKLHE